MPNINGSTIKDILFIDSLYGFAVTTSNSSLQQYILRTTNGGDNWSINYTFNTPNANWYFEKIQFINNNSIGYAISWTEIFKTTNRGDNWTIIQNDLYPDDIYIINEDTMFAAKGNSFNGGVYRSINGGYNWQMIWTLGLGGDNPSKIYMYSKNFGFCCQINYSESRFRRTTDGGFTWIQINDTNFKDIKFADTLIGYKLFSNSVKKTTDGGITWNWQSYPRNLSFTGNKISLINKDTLWFVGPTVMYNSFPYGVVLKTTNGGANWGYQIPDTSVRIVNFQFINFINKNNGWVYLNTNGFHTKFGGSDTTIFVSVKTGNTYSYDNFELINNFPNPFNAFTKIIYKVANRLNVKVVVFDIRGQEIETLTNKQHNQGTYNIIFDGNKLSSGIYFCILFVDNRIIDTKKMILVR